MNINHKLAVILVIVTVCLITVMSPALAAVLEEVSPNSKVYVEDNDFGVMLYSGSGDVTSFIQPIDVDVPPDSATLNSGCEMIDFTGFIAGNIALIQRGYCLFRTKVDNALAAGATGVIIFNSGLTGQTDLVLTTLQEPAVTIPVLFTTHAVGEELYQDWSLSDATVHMSVGASEPTLSFFENEVDGGRIAGTGSGNSGEGRLSALWNMIEEAFTLAEAGLDEEACQQFLDAYRRLDGETPPPDFIEGESVDELGAIILDQIDYLGCE